MGEGSTAAKELQSLVLLVGEVPLSPAILWSSLLLFITPRVLFSVQDCCWFPWALFQPCWTKWVSSTVFLIQWRESGFSAGQGTMRTAGRTSYFFSLEQMKRGRSPKALGYFWLLFAALFVLCILGTGHELPWGHICFLAKNIHKFL